MRLYLSFRDIELSNFPAGIMTKRLLSLVEAKAIIDAARSAKALVCVAKDDLGAPYCEREREKHRELCAALLGHTGIDIGLKDFFGELTANPLCFAELNDQASLLVIDCHYTVDRNPANDPAPSGTRIDGESSTKELRRQRREAMKMNLAPDTAEFHLFELGSPSA